MKKQCLMTFENPGIKESDDMDDWRIPNEKEKNHIMNWIQKYPIKYCVFASFITGTFMIAFLAIEIVETIRIKKVHWIILLVFGLYWVIIFAITIILGRGWKDILRLISDDQIRINDGKITGYNYLTHLLEVSYFEENELKVKKIVRINGAGISEGKDRGYIVYVFYENSIMKLLFYDFLYIPGRVEE